LDKERKDTMATPARQIANTANAQLSTGPRSEEGKARSSQNARKHGLTAKELVVASEQRVEFEELLAEFEAEIRPQGPIQQTLFDELVGAAWNLRRIRSLEAELYASAGAASYSELLANDDLQAKLDRLARHKTRIERTFHRSLRELKALQTNVAVALTLPKRITDIIPPLASTIEIAKRTQTLASYRNRHTEVDALISLEVSNDAMKRPRPATREATAQA
jgi:hypothetical protein